MVSAMPNTMAAQLLRSSCSTTWWWLQGYVTMTTGQENDPDCRSLKQKRLQEDSLARDRILAELEKVPLKVVQTSGSSAGAGSGDFHHYRQYRHAELARLGAIEREHRSEQEKLEFQRRRLAAEEECARITYKKSNKRKRKKQAAKAKRSTNAHRNSDDDFGPQPEPEPAKISNQAANEKNV